MSKNMMLITANLNTIFGQVRLEREHFAGVDIRIMSLLERFLQFLELIAGEDSPVSLGKRRRRKRKKTSIRIKLLSAHTRTCADG